MGQSSCSIVLEEKYLEEKYLKEKDLEEKYLKEKDLKEKEQQMTAFFVLVRNMMRKQSFILENQHLLPVCFYRSIISNFMINTTLDRVII
jgi:hypothetical protein